MRIFITGGTGFIGAPVVKKLENENHNLLLLANHPEKINNISTRNNISILQGDLSNTDKLKNKIKKFKPDAAIHMAWESIPDYGSSASVKNLKYGLDLFQILADCRCKKIICTGSCWEYGQQYGKLNEEMALKPMNAFSAAKNTLHWMGNEIAKENNLQFIWIRLFYVYGPGQKEASLIPYLINCAKTGKTPKIKNPSARNDFVYVEDVADAISLLLKNCTQSAAYNIGSGHSTSVQKIMRIIYDRFKIKYRHNSSDSLNNDGDINFWADISKIKKEIGWKPKISIKEGINRVIEQN